MTGGARPERLTDFDSGVMATVVRARYQGGVFKPVTTVDLPDGTVVEVSVPGQEPARRSVREFEFCGMWRDRDDIPDGVSYVNRLREQNRS